jgi:catechol 2,3-dioxygenase-like lactoylglutathione lyase family enzyme
MIIGVDHMSFTVKDVQKSVDFWTKMLGFETAFLAPRTGDWPEKVTGVSGAQLLVAHLNGHGHRIEFIQYVQGATPGPLPSPSLASAAHICLKVDDIESTHRDLLKAGATNQGQITDVRKGCRAGYIRDPNGIIIELLELRAV